MKSQIISKTLSPSAGSSEFEKTNFVQVNGCWICHNTQIIAESQIGATNVHEPQTEFVKLFVEQIIEPAKPTKPTTNLNGQYNQSSSFTIYVKKRKYLFHVIYDVNDLTFLALTTDTTQQTPMDEIFDLLYAIKSAFLFEDTSSFSNTLGELHHHYQLRAKPKVSYAASAINKNNNINFDDMNSFDEEEKELDINTLNLADSMDSASPSFDYKSENTLSPSPTINCIYNNKHSVSYNAYNTYNTFNVEQETANFVLKKGFMTKQGSKFKTWRFRYFELWSDGTLNYYENEMKLKK
eukprot:79379_1